MTDRLFTEFDNPTAEAWRAAAEKLLKGRDFDKTLRTHTYEGLTLDPIYRVEDIATLDHPHTVPGQFPYVRGTRTAGDLAAPWAIAQEIITPTPEAFNAALRHDLERGQTAVNLMLDTAAKAGMDADHHDAAFVGYCGVSISTLADLKTALAGVDLNTTPVFIHTGTAALPFAGMLFALADAPDAINGGLLADPLAELARNGSLPVDLSTIYDELATLTAWTADHAPHITTLAADGMVYAAGGGSAVQELAYTLAAGVYHIRQLTGRGLDINVVAPRVRFSLSLGANIFMEIAKLRAARLLWAQVVRAFGGDDDAAKLKIHARTGLINKTTTDPYVNMLRTTVEAFAGAVGGVDSMHVAPFDESVRPADAFSRRIARNQQIILQEEVNLTRLIDPAGGSWYVEYLTDWLAREAWGWFQAIEGEGGLLAALKVGTPQNAIADVAAARADRLTGRRDRLVGTNMYADITETPLDSDTTDYDAIRAERAAAVSAARAATPPATLAVDVPAVIDALQSGASLGQVTAALHGNHAAELSVTPINLQRVGKLFEDLRVNARAYAERTGTPPPIFMANMGSLKQYKARADFTRGFYEVGGFHLIDEGGFDTPADAAAAALASGAKAVVICSTDDAYVDLVPPLVEAIRAEKPDTYIIVAGNVHKFDGVDAYIHLKANCYQMNAELQQVLGISG